MSETIFIKVFLGASAAGISYLIGGFDAAIQTLICCMIIDFFIGTYKGAKRKALSSIIMFDGFIKKIITILVVILAVRLDILGATDGLIRNITIYGFIGKELFSIIENLDAVGFPLPEQVRSYFSNGVKFPTEKR